MNDRKLAISPTYNEKENIEAFVRKVCSLEEGFDILIVDDNSPDGTANIVKSLQQELPDRVFLLQRPGKLGLGTAYLDGFRWAIEHGYDYIFEIDADFSHNPDDLARLYNACANEGADVAIGSRYVSGVNVVNWPIGRIIMSYCASLYVRLVTCMKVKDATAGFICYRRRVLEAIDFSRIKMKGYGFQIEMKYSAWKLGFKLKEVPIIFIDRELGHSKMSSGIFGEAMWGVLKLRFRKISSKK